MRLFSIREFCTPSMLMPLPAAGAVVVNHVAGNQGIRNDAVAAELGVAIHVDAIRKLFQEMLLRIIGRSPLLET